MESMRSKLPLQTLRAMKRSLTLLVLGFMVIGGLSADVRAEVQTAFLYSLSNFNGTVPFNWASIHVDEERDEIYVTDTRLGEIRIFNETGMEVFRFGDNLNLGAVIAAAVNREGNILILSRRLSKFSIVVCNFRGEHLSELTLQGFPAEFAGFFPSDMVYRHEQLYLLDNDSLRIAVTDANGLYRTGYDIGTMINIEKEKRGQSEVGGFSVDANRNILFTIPVIFKAFTLSPDGKIAGFGVPGSAPGRFNIVGGIVADEEGYLYVADRLKSAILIFDKDFRFLKEFGYRGRKPDNLIAPKDLSLDHKGRLYVSQLRDRGVSGFQITFE